MSKIIYNVLIGGNSIGMTFKRTEAEAWLKASMYPGEKQIVAVKYDMEKEGK